MFFSSRKSTMWAPRGFTLVELLISCGIIALVSSLVLVKYSAFDSTTLLKSTAYDIALSLREAQVKSVSVVNNGTSADAFDYPYGLSFSDSVAPTVRNLTNKLYVAFRYESTVLETPRYNNLYVGKSIATTTIGRSMIISDLCIKLVGQTDYDCSLTRLDISFRRPEFKALFWAVGGVNNYGRPPQLQPNNVESAKIVVSSPTAATAFATEVTRLGQISVYKE